MVLVDAVQRKINLDELILAVAQNNGNDFKGSTILPRFIERCSY